MKIYTKKGDKGKTSLIGGVRVSKASLRIEAYGTVDELNSFLGIVRDMYTEANAREIIYQIQNNLFTIGSHLAAHPEKNKMQLPDIKDAAVTSLEKEIDKMNEVLPALINFILPGGYIAASYCHVARCVCRRAERLTVELSETEKVEPIIIQYLNRLSDYLFVLSRKICFDAGGEEVIWKP
ncbi:MAG: cob(I)yrinic acid a,c-diamide adenosyltransferase [Bacteroidetes bacterium]|nr:cob(I)yrinic acid a,c-diamide adenosyltransferase [Bacteroidota bacterium]